MTTFLFINTEAASPEVLEFGEFDTVQRAIDHADILAEQKGYCIEIWEHMFTTFPAPTETELIKQNIVTIESLPKARISR